MSDSSYLQAKRVELATRSPWECSSLIFSSALPLAGKENLMMGFLKTLFSRKRLDYEQLQIIQLVAQQVVLSLEGSVNVPGAHKKAMALELMAQMLEEMNIVAPQSLVDAMLESAVTILKAMDSALKAKPKYSFDLSGRPKTGN